MRILRSNPLSTDLKTDWELGRGKIDFSQRISMSAIKALAAQPLTPHSPATAAGCLRPALVPTAGEHSLPLSRLTRPSSLPALGRIRWICADDL